MARRCVGQMHQASAPSPKNQFALQLNSNLFNGTAIKSKRSVLGQSPKSEVRLVGWKRPSSL
jgi:hypothetical protein